MIKGQSQRLEVYPVCIRMCVCLYCMAMGHLSTCDAHQYQKVANNCQFCAGMTLH